MSQKEFRIADEYPYNRSGPVRWILSHLLRYPHLPLLVIGTAVINNFAYSYIQVLIGQAFDVIAQPGWELAALLTVAGWMLAAAATQAILGLGRNYANEFLAQLIERNTRQELYVSLLGKSQTFHGRQRIGDIMARATNDVRSLNIMFSPGVMLIIDGALGIVAPVVLIARLNPQLLLVPSLFLVVFFITVADYARQLNPVSQAMREQFGTMNAGLAEAVSGIEVVKGNAQEWQEYDKFRHNAAQYRDYFIEQGRIQARYLPLLMFSLAWGAAFLHGMLLWQAGRITLGEAVGFIGLVGVLRFPTFVSIFSFNLVQLGIASARRILELINTETKLDENEAGINQPVRGEVRFEKVSFGYNGAPVLQNISFIAQPGETVAIVGQTGSGKTTLTRLINRIFDVDSGRVLIDGVDVRDWNLESLRSQISTIEQDVFLFSRSVADNVAFGHAAATRQEIEHAAQEAQAHEFITTFNQGYETEVGERGVTLSGGQRQRIAIARAFLTNPRILILDDSTSAIDSATEDKIQQAMRRISQERTTFLITHRLSQIRWADRILLIKRGELVDQGSHEELLARSQDYRRIFARYE
ncbi:MAG: ABC transporter ATP-binding protein/permease [Anaerolineae bacterium]|nr:ABC transporter ATP-binding protein/permease [Anaerolineae bacterium]